MLCARLVIAAAPLPRALDAEEDEAIRRLSVAVERRVYDVVHVNVDPRLDALRDREDFTKLVQQGGRSSRSLDTST